MRWHQIVEGLDKVSDSRLSAPLNHQVAPIPAHADASAHHMAETGTIKPSGPLNADQLRKKAERQARVQQQMRDENTRHATKTRDLKTRLTQPN